MWSERGHGFEIFGDWSEPIKWVQSQQSLWIRKTRPSPRRINFPICFWPKRRGCYHSASCNSEQQAVKVSCDRVLTHKGAATQYACLHQLRPCFLVPLASEPTSLPMSEVEATRPLPFTEGNLPFTKSLSILTPKWHCMQLILHLISKWAGGPQGQNHFQSTMLFALFTLIVSWVYKATCLGKTQPNIR